MKKFLSAVLVVCFLATGFTNAQTPLPTDDGVRVGQLENGLTYYIRHNELPKGRAEFHIAQAVGAILEEDNQNGLAHFLEHMAFNGTKHYPDKDLINYFESIGVNFGGNINAYTSLDETVYRLSEVPTAREGVIDSALLVMYDWASAIALLDEEIDNERGVIREEWRTGAGAQRRMWRESMKQKYAGSQYSKRDVIGDTAVINNFTYNELRDYYHKWYGPDLQAIIVVGDIDVDVVEEKIKALFNDIPARKNRGERPIYKIDGNVEPIVSIVLDAEAPNTRIELEFKHEPLPYELRQTVEGYSYGVMNSLISTMLNNRFTEIIATPEASFIGAYAGYGELFKSTDAFRFIVIPKVGQETQAMKDLMNEVERMDRYGFTNAELERAKADMLANYEKSYNERNNTNNISYAREYIRNYLDGEPIPGIETEFELIKILLPQINVDVLNTIAKEQITDENLIISFMAPISADVILPEKDDAIKYWVGINDIVLEAPAEETINKPLVKKAPKAGKIKKTTRNESLGTTEWLLSNGVKVVIKPTTYKQDEILFRSYSEGGMSMISDVNDLPSAMLATDIVEYNGIGDFTLVELQKVLAGKRVTVSPQLSEYSEGMRGNSNVKDFETLLQLIYLYQTSPRQDDNAYNALMSMLSSSLANREANPKQIFSDSIQMTLSGNSPRTFIFDLKTLDKVNQQTALNIYRERFANAADFTFFFTGNIDPNDKATKQLICTWLGGLKGNKTTEKWVDYGTRTPNGVVKNYFTRNMQINTASNFIYYHAPMNYDLVNRLNMRAIGEILSIRYFESIREKEGGSYGVGVRGSISDEPTDKGTLLMQFDTDPDKQEKLMSIVHKEVEDILKNGPRADDLMKIKESFLKDYDEDIEKNGFWLNTILFRYYVDQENYVMNYLKEVNNLSSESIQKTLKTIIDAGNVIEVVMMPAK